MTELERLKNYYDEAKNKIETFDKELQDEFKKDVEFWNNYDNEHVKYCVLINTITKYICIHKFKNCENKCEKAKENVFHCEFCWED